MVEETNPIQVPVKAVQEDINAIASEAGRTLAARQSGKKRAKPGAQTIRSLWHCFEEELNLEVPLGMDLISKRRLLCRALVDGAIRLNPCAVKAVTQFMVPRGVTVNNTQVNIAGGLLERLAKIEATVLEQAAVSSDSEPKSSQDCAREKSGVQHPDSLHDENLASEDG